METPVVLEPLQLTESGSSFPDLPGTRELPPLCCRRCYLPQPWAMQPCQLSGRASPSSSAAADLCTAAGHHPPLYYSRDWGEVAAQAMFHSAAARPPPEARVSTSGRSVTSLHGY